MFLILTCLVCDDLNQIWQPWSMFISEKKKQFSAKCFPDSFSKYIQIKTKIITSLGNTEIGVYFSVKVTFGMWLSYTDWKGSHPLQVLTSSSASLKRGHKNKSMLWINIGAILLPWKVGSLQGRMGIFVLWFWTSFIL